MLKVINNNTLVTLDEQTTTLTNGVSINNETQNRKDIVKGTVVNSTHVNLTAGSVIYFPVYASSMVSTSNGEFYIVNNDDILAIEDK